MAESYSSSLAERLMRRFTDPIGVVDVRPSVERYERATNWPRHHLAVVERSIARTRLDTQPEQGVPMALAAAGSLEPVGGPFSQTPNGADTSRRSPSSTPGSLMRAVRQAREVAAQAGVASGEPPARSAAPRPVASPTTPPPTTVVGPAMHAVSRVALDRRAASTAPVLRRTADPVGERTQDSSGGQGSPGASGIGSNQLEAAPAVRAATTEHAPTAGTQSAGLVWAARAASASAAVASSPSLSLTSSPPLVQRRMADHGTPAAVPALGTSLAAQTSHSSGSLLGADRAPAERRTGTPSSEPAVDRSAAVSVRTIRDLAEVAGPVGPLVARAFASPGQSENASPPAVVPSPMPLRDTTHAAGHSNGAASAGPVPNTGARKPVPMVWRRASTQEPHAVLARSTTTSSSTRTAVNSAPDGAAPEPRSASAGDGLASAGAPAPSSRPNDQGVNIEQLAQEIMRRIMEQATIARERMGEPWH